MPVKKHLEVKKMDTRKVRQGLGLNQAEFWERLEITQSSGSRYESGRPMAELLAEGSDSGGYRGSVTQTEESG